MTRFPTSTSCIAVALATLSALAPGIASAQANNAQAAAAPRAIAIERGPLGAAIARLGRQAGVVIVADPAVLRGRSTPGVRGRFTPGEALARLLAGTGLSARPDGDGGFTLVGGAETASAGGDDVPSDITVMGNRAVTATKTDTKLTETPQSISAITGEQIAARGAIGLQEALRYTPGLRTEPNGVDNRWDYVTARGGFPAAQFVDGMKRADISAAPRTDVYTFERVEVLRGPSSVLYGQGAAGGIINTISKRPEFKTAGEMAVQYGTFDRNQAQVDVTGALDANGTLAARFVGVVRDSGNQVDFGRDDRIALAPSIRFQPDENTDITLLGLYQRDKAAAISAYVPVVASVNAPAGRRLSRSAFLGEPGHDYYDTKEKSATLLVTHRFSDAIRYSGAVRYSRYKSDNGTVNLSVWSGLENPFIDAANTQIERTVFDFRSRVNMLTTDHNLTFDFATGPFEHKVLVGIDYLRSSARTDYAFGAAGPIDIYAPVYTGVEMGAFDPQPRQVASQLGIYVQDQIRYADRVTLVLGARRDRARTVNEGVDRQVDTVTTFRAGLIGDLGSGIAPYVSYSESFQPTLGLNVYGEAYLPQRGTQYEVGVKWQPTPTILASIAAFDVKGTNRLQTDPTNVNNQIQQGEVKSKGIEVEAAWTVARDFTLSASYAYVDAEISKATDPLEVGAPIPTVAKHSAGIWGEKSLDLGGDTGLRLGGGVRYVGPTNELAVYQDDAGGSVVDTQRTPGYTLVDALLALDWKQWSLAVNATNLFDKTYYSSCSVRSACGTGYARTVIGTLGYRF